MTLMLKPHSVETELFSSKLGLWIPHRREPKFLSRNSLALCALHRIFLRNQE